MALLPAGWVTDWVAVSVWQKLGNPAFETGTAAPWTSTTAVVSNTSAGETSHTGSCYAWVDGYGTTLNVWPRPPAQPSAAH